MILTEDNVNNNVTRLYGTVEKAWGSEEIWVSNDMYCSKFLNFETGKQFSMHFHKNKTESWYVLSGKFEIQYIDTRDASILKVEFNVGDTWTNETLLPHRIICLEKGTVLEVSTPDCVEDNYRVLPGDSQK